MDIGGGPNQDLLFVLAANAMRTSDRPTTYWAVQRRHPDGRRWVELAAFAARSDAESAVRAAVDGSHAPEGELRVRQVTRRLA